MLGEVDIVLCIVSHARSRPTGMLWTLSSVSNSFRHAVRTIVRRAIRAALMRWFEDPDAILRSLASHNAIITGSPALLVASELGFTSEGAPLDADSIATFFLPGGDESATTVRIADAKHAISLTMWYSALLIISILRTTMKRTQKVSLPDLRSVPYRANTTVTGTAFTSLSRTQTVT